VNEFTDAVSEASHSVSREVGGGAQRAIVFALKTMGVLKKKKGEIRWQKFAKKPTA
jgi:hypothetical protein